MSSTALHNIPRASASRKTDSFTPGAEVAAMVRNAESRSDGSNSFGSQSIFPKRTHSAICGVMDGATKRIRAPAAKTPGIFPSAMAPPPITTIRRPSNFTKMGKRLMSAFHSLWDRPQREIAVDRSDETPRKNRADIFVRMTCEKALQILSGLAALVKFRQQTFDRIGNIRRRAAISDRMRDRGKLANASANAEVIRVHHAAIHLDLLAFDADVGDPMLSAAIRAAGDVDPELFLKIGQPLFEFVRQPARKTFGFRQCQLAKFRARASHGSASEHRGLHRQGSNFKLMSDRGRMALRHVDDQQILHRGRSNVAIGVAIR